MIKVLGKLHGFFSAPKAYVKVRNALLCSKHIANRLDFQSSARKQIINFMLSTLLTALHIRPPYKQALGHSPKNDCL